MLQKTFCFLALFVALVLTHDHHTPTSAIASRTGYTIASGDAFRAIDPSKSKKAKKNRVRFNLLDDLENANPHTVRAAWNDVDPTELQILQLPSTTSPSSSSALFHSLGWQSYTMNSATVPTTFVTMSSASPLPPVRRQTSPSSATTYTVLAGDTAYNIASRFGVSLTTLEAANLGKAANWNLLSIGLILEIPSPGTAAPAPATGQAGSMGVSSSTQAYAASSTTLAQSSLQDSSSTSSAGLYVWTVSSGDTGNGIASKISVPFSDISSANPTVVWTQLSIGQTLQIPTSAAGTAPSVQLTTGTTTTTTSTFSQGAATTTPAPSPSQSPVTTASLLHVTGDVAVHDVDPQSGSSSSPQNSYVVYTGDGSAESGWPAISSWLSFDAMFDQFEPYMGQNCVDNVQANSPNETDHIRSSILSVANDTYMDPRFMLAVTMQESNGCVRVVSTVGSNSNPGLMQSFEGSGSCNSGGTTLIPCPSSVIRQMIVDGTAAPNINGVTLVSAVNQATSMDDCEPAQAFYRAARFYNSGPSSLPADGDLGGAPGATLCYSSDIANRLMGWVTGTSGCHL